MPERSTISSDFARFLSREREHVLPFVGAGLSVDAGVPAAGELAVLIAARSRGEGCDVDDSAGFVGVSKAVTEQLGHARLQELAAEIINQLQLSPTQAQ